MAFFPELVLASGIPLRKAGGLAGISAGLLALAGGLAYLVSALNIPWWVYGVVLGIGFGLLVGMVVLVNVPRSAQLVLLGTMLGVGADAGVNAASPENVGNMVTALARFVSTVVGSVQGATETTGLPHYSEFPLTIGLWTFLATIALMMLLGTLVEQNEPPAGSGG